MGSIPFFRIPLNLPHAGTIALRIEYHLQGIEAGPEVMEPVERLIELLAPYREAGENPPEEAAGLGRRIVDSIERLQAGHDRLGQAIRNLFECLELGEEGARLSLRAGENPQSPLRPI